MEQEVIAQRERGMIVAQIILLAFTAVLIGMTVPMFRRTGAVAWSVVAVIWVLAVIIAVIAVRTLVRASRLPKIIAVREGNELVFLGERVKFSAVANVDYKNAYGRYGSLQRWGKLTVFTEDGRILSCDYVANVNRVHDRIMQLKYEYAAKERE